SHRSRRCAAPRRRPPRPLPGRAAAGRRRLAGAPARRPGSFGPRPPPAAAAAPRAGPDPRPRGRAAPAPCGASAHGPPPVGAAARLRVVGAALADGTAWSAVQRGAEDGCVLGAALLPEISSALIQTLTETG